MTERTKHNNREEAELLKRGQSTMTIERTKHNDDIEDKAQ